MRGVEGSMTEAEWLSCSDPQPMLEYLRGKAGERKLRLFAVAFCRLQWHLLLADERSQKAVEVAERYADGLAAQPERECAAAEARTAASEAARARRGGDPELSVPALAAYAATAAWYTVYHDAGAAARLTCDDDALAWFAANGIEVPHPKLLRELFGNPFRPAALDPAWLTPDVTALAQAAYDERNLPAGTLDPARLALLADALEEAGCDCAEILGHLRGEGRHVRGCWVVDSLLGKE
jgi:hypothetical protein